MLRYFHFYSFRVSKDYLSYVLLCIIYGWRSVDGNLWRTRFGFYAAPVYSIDFVIWENHSIQQHSRCFLWFYLEKISYYFYLVDWNKSCGWLEIRELVFADHVFWNACAWIHIHRGKNQSNWDWDIRVTNIWGSEQAIWTIFFIRSVEKYRNLFSNTKYIYKFRRIKGKSFI